MFSGHGECIPLGKQGGFASPDGWMKSTERETMEMEFERVYRFVKLLRVMFSCIGLCMITFGFGSSALAHNWQAKLWGKKPLGKAYVYKKGDGKRLHLYVLEPKKGSTKVKPAIIFFHGGGWVAGQAGQFNVQAHAAAEGGMVAIEVQYRLIRGTESPKVCVEDAKSAVRWVREHATELGVDPNRIVEAGGSAGGYLAAFATMVPGWNDPHDDLSVSSKADLLILYNPVIDNSPSGYGYKRFAAEYKRYSPYFYVTPLTPPMLIMSGTNDKLIHEAVLKTFRDKLQEAGVPCDLILYPGAGHGFFNYPPHLKETTEAMLSFLQKHKYLNEP